ncbi:hypothetical protein KIPB_011046, partial [Kipferlia bialata]
EMGSHLDQNLTFLEYEARVSGIGRDRPEDRPDTPLYSSFSRDRLYKPLPLVPLPGMSKGRGRGGREGLGGDGPVVPVVSRPVSVSAMLRERALQRGRESLMRERGQTVVRQRETMTLNGLRTAPFQALHTHS